MNRRISAATRHLVLGAALAAALAVGLLPHASPVAAAEDAPRAIRTADAPPAPAGSAKASAGKADATSKSADAAAEPADSDADAAPDAKGDGQGADITIDRRGIHVEKGKKHVIVQGLGSDHEYGSFEEFVQDAPWLAGLVFLVVTLVFLVPLLIIVLLIWYKVRKNRMLNETMLKLAEKGVVPPAEAMAALDSSRGVPSGPTTTPLYEQAKQIRQRAVASDLRKGVILIAVGLAFVFYWMINEGEPSWVGLVLLFLGVGYCLLWYLEDRSTAPRPSEPPPTGGA